MSLLQNSNAISAGGYDINNSLRFRNSASAYLSRTPASAGNLQKWTYSAWVKRGSLGVGSGFYQTLLDATNSPNLYNMIRFIDDALTFSLDNILVMNTTAVFRDPSAWYHIVVVWDTPNATSTDRAIIYVNGVRQTVTFSFGSYPSQNTNGNINSTNAHAIGRYIYGNSQYYDGYITEVNFIDGQALTPSSFGQTDAVTGSWVAKKYTGTYGNNGFYLPFSDTDSAENLVLSSEDFSNASYWNKTAFPCTVTANSVVAPNGTTTADTITGNNGATSLVFQSWTTATTGTGILTASIYAKAASGSTFTFNAYYESDAENNTDFNLTTGAITDGLGTITSVGNGWYRCTQVIPARTGTGSSAVLFRIWPNSRVSSTNQSIYVWGAQLNYGNVAKRYVATTTAAVTNQGVTENSCTYSQDFTNAVWTKNASTITANTTTAPDGTTTASKLVENATLNGHQIYRTFTESNTTRTLSVYAKLADASRPYVSIAMSDFVAYECRGTFNISNGTILSTSSANANYTSISTSITSVGNGWYRCTLTATKGYVNPNNTIIIGMGDASGNTYYTGSGTTLGIYIWGAQFEESSSVGPYWPTTSSAQSKTFKIGSDKSLGSAGFGYNSWIPNNISLVKDSTYDAMIDSPVNALVSATQPVGNYAVLNPLVTPTTTTITNGNLTANSYNGSSSVNSTIGVSSGKWYWESVNYTDFLAGVCSVPIGSYFPGQSGRTDNSCGWNTAYTLNSSNTYVTGSISKYGTLSGSAAANGDIIGFALDMDAGNLYFYVNGTITNSGNPVFTGITGTVFPSARNGSGGNSPFNFGQRPFAYTPPSGYKAICATNIPDSTIKKGNTVMDAVIYTGNGVSGRAVNTTTNFRPDFAWGRARNVAGGSNILIDSNRGNTKYLISESTGAEGTATDLTFTSTGITWNDGPSLNANGSSYVTWFWQAGQGTNTTNTAGTITSTVSVNATAGFSVATFTTQASGSGTVGHSLGVAPAMVIIKRRDGAGNWLVYHRSTGNTQYTQLNTTAAAQTDSTIWNNTSPTSTVFSLGSGLAGSLSYVAYCWAEIAGFSRFGSYTGNGSADGTFVYTGFRPKYLMVKRTTGSVYAWCVWDSSRETYNVQNAILTVNTANTENTGTLYVDFLGNGFKFRSFSNGSENASGEPYIYAAFAENPFKNANAR